VSNSTISSSFRDPSGFVFKYDGKIYRQINDYYKKEYDHLKQSGLYDELVSKRLLIPHSEVDLPDLKRECYKIIEPEQVPFISYACEWSFSQLKAAALATLKIQLLALERNMCLKDANTTNIQFIQNKPVFIDSLSFNFYEEGKPWVAYKQFCQHFLAPLALMSKVDVSLNQLLRVHLDGIPLDLTSKILPKRTKWSMGLALHIHMHAKSQKKYEGVAVVHQNERKMPKSALISLLQNLQSTVQGLSWRPEGTQWGDYYTFTNYTDDSFDNKKRIIEEFLTEAQPKTVWDLGGNIGTFSRIATKMDINTCCFDIDPAAVEKNYQLVCQNNETLLTPLLLDLTNPTPATGWANEEWLSWTQRASADLCMALALIHHLALGNNLPFNRIAEHFSKLSRHLIIEFVPRTDSQVVKLMQNREEISPFYTQEYFEQVFGEYFDILKKAPVEGSERTMYLMKSK
jgi:hypothetical protein